MDDKEIIYEQARENAELRKQIRQSKEMEDTYYRLYEAERQKNSEADYGLSRNSQK